jgi:predicted SnoaL-like aldol condensation-catalyzing enzyme
MKTTEAQLHAIREWGACLRATGTPLCIEDGVLVEHWDVIQDEATQEQSKSGSLRFGDSFPVFHGERS